MYVYVDMFLSLNMVLNTILLVLTAKLLAIKIRWLRVLLAAGTGSLYALGNIYLNWAVLSLAPVKCLVSVMMLLLAFQPKKLSNLLRLTAVYYLACFATGGAMFGWTFFRQSDITALLGPIRISWLDLLIGSLAATGLLLTAKAGLVNHFLHRASEYEVDVVYKDRQAMFTAIMDTGNSVYSLDQKPVIIVEYQTMKALFSHQAQHFFSCHSPDTWLENLTRCEDQEWLSRIQIIPFRSIGCESVLLAFRPDLVRVRSENSFIETSNVVIGVYAGNLSIKNRFNALLHPAIIQLTVREEVNTCVSPG